MEELGGPVDHTPVRDPDGLQTETDSEDRDPPAVAAYDVDTDARLFGAKRTSSLRQTSTSAPIWARYCTRL